MSHQFQPFHPQNRSKVAVVTGGNKGVGYAVVRKLLKKFRGVVYLTARNEEKGLAACEQLKKEGLPPAKFYQLDITDRQQIMEFRQYLQKTYGGIDVLINNASVPHKISGGDDDTDDEEANEENTAQEEHQQPAEAANGKAPGDAKVEENGPNHQGPNVTGQHSEEKSLPGLKIEIKVDVEEKKQESEKGEEAQKKELTQDEKIAEESRLLAESYKAHRKVSKPSEEFWVPKVDVDPRVDLAENTMKTNVVGTLNVIHCLLPLFRPHGRIINMSSSLGVLSSVQNAQLREKFEDTYLLESDLMEILRTYITDVKENKAEEKGWPKNVWVLSKLAINLMTRIMARDHKYDERKDVLITSCCPDLSEDLTPLTADQGAETPLYLALLPKGDKHLHGKIFKDKKILEWE